MEAALLELTQAQRLPRLSTEELRPPTAPRLRKAKTTKKRSRSSVGSTWQLFRLSKRPWTKIPSQTCPSLWTRWQGSMLTSDPPLPALLSLSHSLHLLRSPLLLLLLRQHQHQRHRLSRPSPLEALSHQRRQTSPSLPQRPVQLLQLLPSLLLLPTLLPAYHSVNRPQNHLRPQQLHLLQHLSLTPRKQHPKRLSQRRQKRTRANQLLHLCPRVASLLLASH